MIKLRTVLLYNQLYYVLLIITLLITLINISIPISSKYTGKEDKVIGKITKIYIDGNYLRLDIYGREKIIGNYYFKTKKDRDYFKKKLFLGDKIYLEGTLREPESTKTKNLFDYKKYLNHKKIFYLFDIENYKKISRNKNIYYKVKQLIINRIDNNPYLYTFLLGDKSYLKQDVITSFQNNGISHLFAISGMHINLLGTILLKILSKIKIREEKRYLYTSFFLIFYAVLTGLSASVLRGVLFFILFSVNKIFYFYIKSTNIFIISLSISLLMNPYLLYDIGFWYSFSISFSLLIMAEYINKYKTYFLKLLMTSMIAFIISIPISLYNFYQLNILSIIYNLFYVPFVSIVLFPLSLLTLICKPLEPLYNMFTSILENTSLFLGKITGGTFVFSKIHNVVYIIYFIFIILFYIGLKKKEKKYLIPLFFLIFVHYLHPYINTNDYIKMIDVGQGDSFLLHSNNKNILIDTGGIMTYKTKNWQKRKDESSIVSKVTIPLLKSLGIKKIDYLLLTHGDYDHLGETINLINNFKVDKIYMNEGDINHLEKEIINKFDNVEISYENTQIHLGNCTLIQLNKDQKEENDSSSVYYVVCNNIKMLFMGDATIKSEEYILNKYDIDEVDILKIGHHGSITSSSEEFIKTTNPKIALISAGKDNKFHHPRKEILTRLNKYNVKYYLTINDGTTTINLNNYKISTVKSK